MNYKRRKPRRQVRCTLCTDRRWGNQQSAAKPRERALKALWFDEQLRPIGVAKVTF